MPASVRPGHFDVSLELGPDTSLLATYSSMASILKSIKSTFAFNVFERVFKDFGLPSTIRTDNGVPFASLNALFGLSKLAVWWLRLSIQIERIKPVAKNSQSVAVIV